MPPSQASRSLKGKPLAIAALLALASLSAFGQQTAAEYLAFLPAATRESLLSTGSVTYFADRVADLPILSAAPFSASVRAVLGGADVNMASESLFLLDRPTAATREELDAKMYQAFTGFTAMKGLLVYSESKKAMEIFILDSFRVASPATTAALPDPPAKPVPVHAEFVIYQKEEQFNDVYSQFTFDSLDSGYRVSLVNLTPLNYLFVTLVQPGSLHTTFLVLPLKDKLLVYGVTAAGTARLFGLEKTKQSSFSNRMKALESWFARNLGLRLEAGGAER